MISTRFIRQSLVGSHYYRNLVRTLSNSRDKSDKIKVGSRKFEEEVASHKMKYILVTGGVISGVGKGVIASSFGTLLNCNGISVTSLKIDPYINIDAGTFSPYEHGNYYFQHVVMLIPCDFLIYFYIVAKNLNFRLKINCVLGKSSLYLRLFINIPLLFRFSR